MNQEERRADWTVVAAIALIALGVWFLLGNIIPGWAYIVRKAAAFAWPLALIALGVALLVTAQRGGFRGADIRGKRLYRSRASRMVGGVLGGLGDFLGIDPTWLRIGYVAFGVVSGVWPAVVLYVVAMVVIPEGSAPVSEWPASEASAPAPPAPPAPAPPAPPEAPQSGDERPAQS